MEKHGICHVEWRSTDFERTKGFYGGLFEWSFQDWDGNYLLFQSPGGIGGGFEKVSAPNPGKSPVVYVLVEDVEPYVVRAAELGGGVVMPKTQIGDVGWMALLSDPDGNHVGVFQSAQR